jgi:lipopolysaccharide transport system ATP-binding protein
MSGSKKPEKGLPMSSEIAIKIESLGKCYHIYDKPRDRLMQMLLRGKKNYFREFWALKDVSLEVTKGQTIGVIGPNGCGKSTLLQMIAGTLSPTSGSIEVNGRIAALLELGSGFNPEFTGRENVHLNGIILGLSKEEIDRKFSDIEKFADIGSFIDQPVKTYSSGMVVRLAFSVSVNVCPDILIVDEALAVGDAAFQFKCIERLEKLTRSGMTLLFVSHDLNMLKMFCDQVLYLRNGCERASGLAEDVTNIYIMDLRDDQTRLNKAGGKIMQKAALDDGFAYGTNQGKIANAEFMLGNRFCHLTKGQEISFWVDVEVDDSVRNPSISVLVENVKKIPIGGQHFLINKRALINGVYKSRLQCTFPANFASGRYFVTIRLEDYSTDQNFLVIDKQGAVLSFEVTDTGPNGVRGMVDLGIKLTQQEAM